MGVKEDDLITGYIPQTNPTTIENNKQKPINLGSGEISLSAGEYGITPLIKTSIRFAPDNENNKPIIPPLMVMSKVSMRSLYLLL